MNVVLLRESARVFAVWCVKFTTRLLRLILNSWCCGKLHGEIKNKRCGFSACYAEDKISGEIENEGGMPCVRQDAWQRDVAVTALKGWG